jgi:diadenosine tetraphosphate (Ap4A) HIT family hydrolase/CTP:molybdopterin cytidylyltransferase MocA
VSDRRWICLVLAAGKGIRMKSESAKVLHELEGRSLLAHVLETASRLALDRTLVVVGHQAEEVIRRHSSFAVETVLQEPQLGTGHAVMVAEPLLRGEPAEAALLVLYGDVPLLRENTLRELMERHVLEENAVTVLAAEVQDPAGYGRILRDPEGRFLRIVEDRDLAPEQRKCREINSGIYVFQLGRLLGALTGLRADNAQREYYLTDTLESIRETGGRIGVFALSDPEEISGVNTPEQLAAAGAVLANRRDAPPDCAVCAALSREELRVETRDGIEVLLAPHPYNSGHLWIAPRHHVVSYESLDDPERDLIFLLAREAEAWCDAAFSPHGINVGYNSGWPGDHLVLHVIPRWAGDSNFMPVIAGVKLLPETIADSRRRILEAREKLSRASSGALENQPGGAP